MRTPFASFRAGAAFAASVGLVALTSWGAPQPGKRENDVLWRKDSGEVSIWRIDAKTGKTATGQTIATVPAIWSIVGAADFDNNQNGDILWRNTGNGDVAIWLLNDFTIAGTKTIFPGLSLQWKTIGTGDFDNDSKGDVLWLNTATRELYVWLMNGFVAKNPNGSLGTLPPDMQVLTIGDFDGDHMSDLLVRDTGTGAVSVWRMTGATVGPKTQVWPSWPSSFTALGTGDLSNDGRDDVIWSNLNGDVVLWTMTGTSANSWLVYKGVSSSWRFGGSGDFNSDGRWDMIWHNGSQRDVVTWMMQDAAVKDAGTLSSSIDSTWQIVGLLSNEP